MSDTGSIEIIPAQSRHKEFIYATWLRCYKYGSPFGKRIAPDIFFKRHHMVAERILARPTTTALVAADGTDSNTIYGYLISERYERPLVHFVYVKEAFRRLGIAKRLFQHAGIDPNAATFTHRTYEFSWFEPKYPGLSYDPYLI